MMRRDGDSPGYLVAFSDRELTEALVKSVFSSYEDLASVDSIIDKDFRKTLVTFKNESAAEKACKELNGKFIQGHKLMLQLIQRKDTNRPPAPRVVGLIRHCHLTFPKSISVDDIMKMFSRYGKVVNFSEYLHQPTSNRTSLIIEYEKASVACTAVEEIEMLNANGNNTIQCRLISEDELAPVPAYAASKFRNSGGAPQPEFPRSTPRTTRPFQPRGPPFPDGHAQTQRGGPFSQLAAHDFGLASRGHGGPQFGRGAGRRGAGRFGHSHTPPAQTYDPDSFEFNGDFRPQTQRMEDGSSQEYPPVTVQWKPRPNAPSHSNRIDIYSPPGSRLFISFSHALPKELLYNIFSKYGPLESVYLLKGKNFGFAKYQSAEDAQDAINSLNNRFVEGSACRVSVADPPPAKPQTEFSSNIISKSNLPFQQTGNTSPGQSATGMNPKFGSPPPLSPSTLAAASAAVLQAVGTPSPPAVTPGSEEANPSSLLLSLYPQEILNNPVSVAYAQAHVAHLYYAQVAYEKIMQAVGYTAPGFKTEESSDSSNKARKPTPGNNKLFIDTTMNEPASDFFTPQAGENGGQYIPHPNSAPACPVVEVQWD